MEYLTSLNSKQLEAVQTTEGYLRVIAGAGSGKTKLLVSRYAYLVKEYGIDPANILCVTFTNKAAGEMKRRIRALIGPEYDTSLICTYHGFCVRVLREDIEKIFYPKEFQIIDTSQQKAILGEVYQKFDLKLDHASFEKMVKCIAYVKATCDYVPKMCCTEHCQILPEINTLDDRIIEEYLQRQKAVYAMDFDDLMYFTLDVFNRCHEVLSKWQDRLNYIQVDEFQDSSKIEMTLVNLLSGKHKNLMIVGDPDQNIYEWRGSDVKLLVDFDKTHVPTDTVFLNQNYRSTPEILKCANTLIEKNVYRLKKDLFTQNPNGAPVYHYHLKNEFLEAEKIIEEIVALKQNEKCNFSDFAVLYRSGFLSRVIEKKFTENGIPYEIFGGVKFYHRMEIQDVMAYLRVMAFGDDVSFKRIVNKPRRRFGRTKLQHLATLQTGNEPLYEVLKQNLEDPVFKNSGAARFVDIIEALRQDIGKLPVSELVSKVCDVTGYEKYIRELGDMERFDNLSEFKRIASEFEQNFGESVSLKEFINQIALQSEDDGEESCDMVKLMTIHAAKGLEFPYVFVVGFTEGIFPSSKTIEERKDLGLEEERRLCYVAITRAEKRLFLLDSEGYTQNEKQKLPSRFLKEIGEENYIRVGNISKELQFKADMYVSGQPLEEPAKTTKKVGDTVEHPAFGTGVIIGYGRTKNSFKIKFERLNSERDISADFFNREHRLPEIKLPIDSEVESGGDEPINVPLSQLLPDGDEEKCNEDLQRESPCDEKVDIENNRPKVDLNEWYEAVDNMTVEEVIEEEITEQVEQTEETEHVEGTESANAKLPDVSETENLWKRDDVPKTGWTCVGVTDLGAPVGICQMCGHQIIRYVHHMQHPDFRDLDVGCICAGKMEGDIDAAKQREQDFKNKQSRRENFKKRKWKTSKNNNSYLKIKEHLVVLYFNKKFNNWKYSIDNQFCVEVYPTREQAVDAAFEVLDGIINK